MSSLVFVIRGEQPPGDPPVHGFAVGTGRDQAQQQVPQHRPLFGRRPLVDLLGRLGNRPADAAGVAVAGDGERPALPPLPRLAQRVGQQR